MPTVTIRVVKPLNLKVPTSTLRDMRDIGTQAVAIVRDRIDAGRNVNDSPAKPYSTRGPVYAAIYSQGTIKRGGVTENRSKTELRGAFGFRRGELGKMGVKAARGRKTVRFENYAAMKKAMGGSGRRDLILTGKMLGSMGIVESTRTSVTVGFVREGEEMTRVSVSSRCRPTTPTT